MGATGNAHAQEEEGGREEAEWSEEPDETLVLLGSFVWGGSYVLTSLAGPWAGRCYRPFSGGCPSEDPAWEPFRWLGFVPLAGPWIQLAFKPGDLGDDAWAPWLILTGSAQLAGLVSLILAFALPSRRRRDVEVGAIVAPQLTGLSFSGRF